jgi:hypothetical protein
MISVELQGGLGNQLFQLAFLDYISKKTRKEKYLQKLSSPDTVHSNENYFETIFKKWKPLYKEGINACLITEKLDIKKQEWNISEENVLLKGYFQNYEYIDPIRDEFIQKLSFNEKILEKYSDINKQIVIHVRGGDYKNNKFHEQSLTNYYKRCMESCKGDMFIVCTNDIPYATQLIENCNFIQENEVDTLYIMSKAKGVICANSSFSWWGAYLNPNRPIFIPSKWFNSDSFPHENYQVLGWNVF